VALEQPTREEAMSSTVQAESTARDFDFWMGSWNVHNRRLRRRLAGSDDW
jgi:hypothetical protein